MSFRSQEDQVTALKSLVGKDVYVFAFEGEHVQISLGKRKYLLSTPPVPLFDEPAVEDFEPGDGFLGVRIPDSVEDIDEYEEEDDEADDDDTGFDMFNVR